MKFEDAVIQILNRLDKNPETFVKQKEIKKVRVGNHHFGQIFGFINNEQLANSKGESEEQMEYMINPKGKKFLIEKESAQRQEHFNRILALTGTIIALIGIHGFLKDIRVINESTSWITIIFSSFILLSLGPMVRFLWDSYGS